jgi:outer membrane protein
MNKLKWIQSFTFFLSFLAGNVMGQDLMTLEKTLEVAYQNSPTIQQSKFGLIQTRELYNVQKAGLKSEFSLEISPFSYVNATSYSLDFEKYQNYKTLSSIGKFNIKQPIKATDGEIILSNTFGYESNSTNDKNPQNNFTNTLNLTLTQPIFKYNRAKMDLRQVELNLENNLLQYAIDKLSIEQQVSQDFYSVYQAQQSLNISKEELENQKKSYEIIKNKVDAGLSAREEFWQADLNLANARSSVYTAEVSLENAKDQLKKTIGLNLSTNFDVLANVEVKTINITLQDAIDYALKQRMQLRQQQINIEKSQFNLIQKKETNKFNGDITLSMGLFGKNPNVGNVYQQTEDNENVNLSFNIPIWDWGVRRSTIKVAEASLQASELSLEQEKTSIELNIRKVFRNLQNLVNQIEIAKKSVENAQLTYELNLEKYQNGDLTSMDLSLYQNQLSSKKNELTNSLISYKLELLNLKIQTLWDFETNKSIVPQPYSSEFEK